MKAHRSIGGTGMREWPGRVLKGKKMAGQMGNETVTVQNLKVFGVDEAENLLDTNIQLILGRVAENSEVIFCADIKQCDYKNIHMSGIPKLIARLKGNKLFGMVKLLKTERSEVAALADLLD